MTASRRMVPITSFFLVIGLTGCVSVAPEGQGRGPGFYNPSPYYPQDTGTRVYCDVRIVSVQEGSVLASATGQGKPADLQRLATALAKKLKAGSPVKGESITVVSLRNRMETVRGRAIADELADKLTGALVETGWFDVKERIDLLRVMSEKELDSADIVNNPSVRGRLGGVTKVVIGGVSVSSP